MRYHFHKHVLHHIQPLDRISLAIYDLKDRLLMQRRLEVLSYRYITNCILPQSVQIPLMHY